MLALMLMFPFDYLLAFQQLPSNQQLKSFATCKLTLCSVLTPYIVRNSMHTFQSNSVQAASSAQLTPRYSFISSIDVQPPLLYPLTALLPDIWYQLPHSSPLNTNLRLDLRRLNRLGWFLTLLGLWWWWSLSGRLNGRWSTTSPIPGRAIVASKTLSACSLEIVPKMH